MPNRRGGVPHEEVELPRESADDAAYNESNILAALEEHGNRMTSPRRQLAALLARQTESFSVEEIVAGMPSLGRATVYRTMRLLVDVGILCKTAMPNGAPRYSLDGAPHHHHLVCVSCGRIDEFRHPVLERMLRTMESQSAGEFIGHTLELYHRCGACRENGKSIDVGSQGNHLHVH